MLKSHTELVEVRSASHHNIIQHENNTLFISRNDFRDHYVQI